MLTFDRNPTWRPDPDFEALLAARELAWRHRFGSKPGFLLWQGPREHLTFYKNLTSNRPRAPVFDVTAPIVRVDGVRSGAISAWLEANGFTLGAQAPPPLRGFPILFPAGGAALFRRQWAHAWRDEPGKLDAWLRRLEDTANHLIVG